MSVTNCPPGTANARARERPEDKPRSCRRRCSSNAFGDLPVDSSFETGDIRVVTGNVRDGPSS